MPRIPYPDVASLPEAAQRQIAGTPLNVVRISAVASPALFVAQGLLGSAIADPAVLEPQIREVAILRVAHLSNSAYELYHHRPLARAAGLGEDELAAIERQDYGRLEPTLAAVCRFTDEVVHELTPGDATLVALRACVSDEVVVNLVLTVGCYMSIARLIATTGIELDEAPLEKLTTGR